jgi:hypothetical protein
VSSPKGQRIVLPPLTDGQQVPDDGLRAEHRTFALEYLANGFNGTQAYQKTYPAASYRTAQTASYTLLRKHEIREFLRPRMEASWKARQMDGEEALARVAMAASIDVRVFFGEKGELLAPKDWPEEVAGCVKAVQHGPYGLKLTLVDPLTAQRIILEQTGKLKGLADGFDALAAAIKGDLEKHGRARE